MATEEGVFQLEEGEGRAMSSGTSFDLPGSGTATPTSLQPAKSEVSLCRKAMAQIEVEEDVCSICLDEFSEEDPGVPTKCGHSYHLQCVMQWAQRSRECPMCFHELKLQDPDLHEMLPFGEYVSPQQAAAQAATLESWDLERLLLHLAAANQRHERRAAREAARQHRSSGGRRSSGGEASAPQPIQRHASDGVAAAGRGSSRHAAGASASGRPALEHTSSGVPAPGPRSPSAPAGAFPASWPPAGARGALGGDEAGSSSSGGGGARQQQQQQHHGLSPGLKAASQSIKSRFAALKIKESFSKTTKEIKALFSPTHNRPDRPGAAGS